MSNYSVGYHRTDTTIRIEVEADPATIQEMVLKFNPLVQNVLAAAIVEGKARAEGTPVKKPCGCGDGT